MSDEKWTYTPKTAAEIEALAWDIISGQVFGTWGCPPELIPSCFMVLALMNLDQLSALKDANIIQIYEHISKAGPGAINGYPIFFSAHYINQDDMNRVAARVEEIKKFRETTGPSQ